MFIVFRKTITKSLSIRILLSACLENERKYLKIIIEKLLFYLICIEIA